MNQAIVKWIKIVVMRTLREKNLIGLDVSNLISAGMLGYTQALNRFDPSRGVKFKTFAEYRIKGAVLDEVRKMIGDERAKTRRPYKVNQFDFDAGTSDEGFAMLQVESKIDLEVFMKNVNLEPRELEILRCRVEGMNLKEISGKFGFSESRASQLLAKIKKEVYLYYKRDMNFTFKLVTHDCPSCLAENTVSDMCEEFRCDTCDSDLLIVCGVPILAVTEEGE
jgi:RNA polymerase sigma factor (sigma-70 family)